MRDSARGERREALRRDEEGSGWIDAEEDWMRGLVGWGSGVQTLILETSGLGFALDCWCGTCGLGIAWVLDSELNIDGSRSFQREYLPESVFEGCAKKHGIIISTTMMSARGIYSARSIAGNLRFFIRPFFLSDYTFRRCGKIHFHKSFTKSNEFTSK